MSEKKELNKEDLNKMSGGGGAIYNRDDSDDKNKEAVPPKSEPAQGIPRGQLLFGLVNNETSQVKTIMLSEKGCN